MMQWIVMGLVAVAIICVAWDMYTERKARDDTDSKLQVMDLKLTEARERAKRTVRELEQLKTRVNIIDEVQRVHSEEIDELQRTFCRRTAEPVEAGSVSDVEEEDEQDSHTAAELVRQLEAQSGQVVHIRTGKVGDGFRYESTDN
jgi:hypothetical protein